MEERQKNRILRHVAETYAVSPETPWADENLVLRHPASGKWFAILMEVAPRHLGLEGDEALDVMNVKCDPRMIGSLLAEEGFRPAYHMNKDHWVSILLDETVSDKTIFPLIELSWDSVAPRRRAKKQDTKKTTEDMP